MSVLVVTKYFGHVNKLHLNWWHLTGIAIAVVITASGLIYGGIRYGLNQSQPDNIADTLQKQVAQQRDDLLGTKRQTEEDMNALAVRLGELKAQVIRLNALGQRLVQMAKLDKGEFNFERPPAQGGPETAERGSPLQVTDFVASMDDLLHQIEHRSLQLNVLESMLMNRNLQEEVYPAGRPVRRGWVSSYFGYRTDPFNGRVAHHDGVDIASAEGADILAVAAGVITWAGPRYGFGHLVEVNHGNGYVTRYAHNEEILVQVGATVKKGQVLAKMGSTGRSTGPHVHFEVLKSGKMVDPANYLQISG
ncbi:MAG: M23 family metallopeptidase [Gammaproteobacteria bacterium]|nr:M23 family metallopeptidase [Gammaproteobacteria bacterium]